MSEESSDKSESEKEANRPTFEGELIQNSKETEEESRDPEE